MPERTFASVYAIEEQGGRNSKSARNLISNGAELPQPHTS